MAVPDKPITRLERYWAAILDKIQGGGGSPVTIEPLTVTENGTTTAPGGKAYSPVTVNVPSPNSIQTIESTLDEPFGMMTAEQITALIGQIYSGDVTCELEYDASAIGFSSGHLTAPSYKASRLRGDVYFVGVMQGGDAVTDWTALNILYNVTNGVTIYAIVSGTPRDITQYASLITTTVKLGIHPMPEEA